MAKQNEYKLARHYTETGVLLQEARVKGNLSQREVAEHLGYSAAQHISNMERGIAPPPNNKLAKLLKMLRVSIDDYFKVYGKEDLARQRKEILAARK